MHKQFLKVIAELRKETQKRKFDQTLDLIINFQDFDAKKKSIKIFFVFPYKFKENKICAFLEGTNKEVDKVIAKEEFNIKKSEIKRITKEYDFFIASAKLMPLIAKNFGKILGSAGKMPDPKTGGILVRPDEKTIGEIVNKLKKTTSIKIKENSVKIAIGKESMSGDELAENAEAGYNAILEILPQKKENIKNVMLKFTMGKPILLNKE